MVQSTVYMSTISRSISLLHIHSIQSKQKHIKPYQKIPHTPTTKTTLHQKHGSRKTTSQQKSPIRFPSYTHQRRPGNPHPHRSRPFQHQKQQKAQQRPSSHDPKIRSPQLGKSPRRWNHRTGSRRTSRGNSRRRNHSGAQTRRISHTRRWLPKSK